MVLNFEPALKMGTFRPEVNTWNCGFDEANMEFSVLLQERHRIDPSHQQDVQVWLEAEVSLPRW